MGRQSEVCPFKSKQLARWILWDCQKDSGMQWELIGITGKQLLLLERRLI